MRTACPGCQATYEVPDALIGAGRMLRCAKCGQDWLATGTAPPPEPTTPPESPPPPATGPRPAAQDPPHGDLPPPTPALRRAPQLIDPPLPDPWNPRASRGAVAALWAAWVASGLLLGALVVGAWVYREPIMQAWPPSARVYLLLGATRNG